MNKYKPPDLGSEGNMSKSILTKREKEVFELKSDDVSFNYETVVHKGLEGME